MMQMPSEGAPAMPEPDPTAVWIDGAWRWLQTSLAPRVAMLAFASLLLGWLVFSATYRWSVRRRSTGWRYWSLASAGALAEEGALRTACVQVMASLRHGDLVVVRRRDERGIHSIVGIRGEQNWPVIAAFAKACSAVATECDPPVLDTSNVARSMTHVRDAYRGASSSLGERSHLTNSMPEVLPNEGDWVALVVRNRRTREQRAIQRWYQTHRHAVTINVASHVHVAKGAAMGTMWAGSEVSFDSAEAILQSTANGFIGFDVFVRARGRKPFMVPSLTAVVGAATVAASPALRVPAAVVAVLAVVGTWRGVLTSAFDVGVAQIERGVFPPIRHRWYHHKPGRSVVGAEGTPNQMQRNWYPLSRSALPIGPQYPVELAAPKSGTAVVTVAVSNREPAAALCRPHGPLLGVAGPQDRRMWLSDEVLRAGVFACGVPRSGKSGLLQNVFAWHLSQLEAGAPGRRVVIHFESKDGPAILGEWLPRAHEAGQLNKVRIVELNVVDGDPNGSEYCTIDLFPACGTIQNRAANFVSALAYANTEEMTETTRLTAVLKRTVALALCVTPEIAEAAMLLPDRSPIFYTSVLLGMEGDADVVEQSPALRLWEALRSAAIQAEHAARGTTEGDLDVLAPNVPRLTELAACVARARQLFESWKATQRRQNFESSQNRIGELLDVDAYFSNDRTKLTWDQVIAENLIVFVNHGSPVTSGVPRVAKSGVNRLAAMLMYAMRDAVEANCGGWQKQGNFMCVSGDELGVLSGVGAEVVEWLRQEGGAFGVLLGFATQAITQLPDEVRNAVMGFGTIAWLEPGDNPSQLRYAREFLDGIEPGVWSAQLTEMPKYTAIVRTRVDGIPQPPCMVRLRWLMDPALSWREVTALIRGEDVAL